MRRNVSSRLLFSDDDNGQSSFLDIENPPDRPQTRRQQQQQRGVSMSLSRTLLFTLTTWSSAVFSRATQNSILLSPTKWPSVFHYLFFVILCCLIYSVSSTLSSALIAVAMLCAVYIFFNTTSRTDLSSTIGSREHSILYINEPLPVKKSVINGLGVELLDDGTQYAGEFKKGLRTGKGLIDKHGICLYGGDWVEGDPSGYGVENILNYGAVYKGQFLRGTRSGYGIMQISNGDEYIGEWRNGNRHGIGRQNYVDRSFYEGQFSKDRKHGFGAYHSNENIYRGEYCQDNISGYGVHLTSFGYKYEGSWRDNQMDGYGISIEKNNPKPLAGKWTNGFLKEEDYIPIADPCIERAMQAAREAAQKCRELGAIEDQVFKAVNAANNAYRAAQLASTNAHYINTLHPLDLRRLAVTASTGSLKALRNLGNFGRSTAKNVARLMVG